MFLLLFSLFLASASAFNWTQPDPGRLCKPGENGTAPGIKYYEDEDSYEMLPFFYLGCGGDRNRFDSQSPRMADAEPCPGYPRPLSRCNTGEYPGIQPKPCPPTAYCQQGMIGRGYGQCCDIGAKERVKENRNAPNCKISGLIAVVRKMWHGGEKTFLGRNCSHNFCPQESKCHQGEFYAYCCAKQKIVVNP